MTESQIVTFVAALVTMPFVRAQVASDPIGRVLWERKLFLVDVRNEGLAIVFPEEARKTIDYTRPDSEYVYSIVAPTGRALVAVRREFDPGAPSKDTLIRREIGESIGPEEIIPTPFAAIFQCAVSRNEKFILVAGRLGEAATKKRDGIYLLTKGSPNAEFVAPYPGAGLNGAIRSLNVNDDGDVVVYEDAGSIVELVGSGKHRVVTALHSGAFPTLMADGRTYLYCEDGRLIEGGGKLRRSILKVPEIRGGIRTIPDGKFVAFGMNVAGEPGITQLRICELTSRKCVDGPKYSEWVAGRETFWIQR
jgi:hypothetical protein